MSRRLKGKKAREGEANAAVSLYPVVGGGQSTAIRRFARPQQTDTRNTRRRGSSLLAHVTSPVAPVVSMSAEPSAPAVIVGEVPLIVLGGALGHSSTQ